MATVTTTWTNPAGATLDKATGGTIDETMTDALASNFYGMGGTVGYIACRAFNSANISLTSGVLTTIALNSERWDTDPNGAMHDLVTNNSRITCRTSGLYIATANVLLVANATGHRSLQLLVNGTTAIGYVDVPGSTAVAFCGLSLTATFVLAATDYIEMQVLQDSGGALNVVASSALSPELMLSKI